MVVAISFLATGVILLAFPRRMQKNETEVYEKLPAFLKLFRSGSYIKSRRFIWVTRAWGVVLIAVGIFMILILVPWLLGHKS